MTGSILVIDGDPFTREMIETALQQAGYHTWTASDAEQGRALACAHAPDLIIAGVQAQGSDGLSLIQTLRRDNATAAVPVILITEGHGAESTPRGAELGADACLPKPLKMESLVSTVAARLRRQEPQRGETAPRAAELRTQVFLGLPHEFNTPLAAIFNAGELIQTARSDAPPPDLELMGKTIVEAAGRLRRVTEQLLIYAQIEFLSARSQELGALLEARTAATATLIKDAAERAGRRANRLQDLEFELEEAPVSMAPDLLARIIEELVDNAVKFSEPNTKVRIVSSHRAGALSIEFVDQGGGISEKQLTEIGPFAQFQRCLYEHKCAGLGLAIAKKLVELHDGAFEIQSRAEQGTTVRLRLSAPPS